MMGLTCAALLLGLSRMLSAEGEPSINACYTPVYGKPAILLLKAGECLPCLPFMYAESWSQAFMQDLPCLPYTYEVSWSSAFMQVLCSCRWG